MQDRYSRRVGEGGLAAGEGARDRVVFDLGSGFFMLVASRRSKLKFKFDTKCFGSAHSQSRTSGRIPLTVSLNVFLSSIFIYHSSGGGGGGLARAGLQISNEPRPISPLPPAAPRPATPSAAGFVQK